MRWNRAACLLIDAALATALLLMPLGRQLLSQNQALQTLAGATPQPSQPSPPQHFVMIDPAHGGADSGAALNPAMPEKDVNLAFGRRLRQELSSRGIQAALVRDSDITLSTDQRAGIVNAAQPALYISIHSTSQGSGVALYTAMLPAGGENSGRFLDWQTAQSASLVRSQWAEQQIAAAMQKMHLPLRSLVAALRPLNNVTVPALAVEIAPAGGDVSQLAAIDYQNRVCAALANAIAAIGPSLQPTAGALQ